MTRYLCERTTRHPACGDSLIPLDVLHIDGPNGSRWYVHDLDDRWTSGGWHDQRGHPDRIVKTTTVLAHCKGPNLKDVRAWVRKVAA